MHPGLTPVVFRTRVKLTPIIRHWKPATVLAGLLLLFIYFNNTSRFLQRTSARATVLAHRGVGQRYDIPIESAACTAVHLLRPEHEYLENTIPSMQAAFDRGADVVEFDIHPTTDRQFAVFHDRSLECKTNGSGATRAHTMAELKTLDIGYGYTFDGGRTFPFRGRGIGLMPSMSEVFQAFPGGSFLIDVKDNESDDATLLSEFLSRLSPAQLSRLIIFARGSTGAILRAKFPSLRIFSAGSVASCVLQYIGYGWIGVTPASCRNSALFIPINVAPWLWGWPDKFMTRMAASGSSVIAMGPYPAREISPGLDTRELLGRLPAGYWGGIWTNELDLASAQR
jgi:glycerophosphoryl diester phosphodiesterase